MHVHSAQTPKLRILAISRSSCTPLNWPRTIEKLSVPWNVRNTFCAPLLYQKSQNLHQIFPRSKRGVALLGQDKVFSENKLFYVIPRPKKHRNGVFTCHSGFLIRISNFRSKFPTVQKGRGPKKIPQGFEFENFQRCLYRPWRNSRRISQLVRIFSQFCQNIEDYSHTINTICKIEQFYSKLLKNI